jgi:hypothetical protein
MLPALNSFMFRGASEYLEDLTSRIGAPLLSHLDITFFNQLVFNTPRLWSFISHAEKLGSQDQINDAQMTFSDHNVKLLLHTTLGHSEYSEVNLTILCKPSDWQLSSLTQICDSPFFSINLENLEICEPLSRLWNSRSRSSWQEDVENIQWLDLLHPFTTVKSLSLSRDFTPRVVPALQELSGERIMDVLPALQRIFLFESSLSGLVKEAFEQFPTARQLSGHPVAVNRWGQL